MQKLREIINVKLMLQQDKVAALVEVEILKVVLLVVVLVEVLENVVAVPKAV